MAEDLEARLSLHRTWRDSHGELNDAPNEALERIATLRAENERLLAAIAAEREACARVAEGLHRSEVVFQDANTQYGYAEARTDIATAIRSRGEQER